MTRWRAAQLFGASLVLALGILLLLRSALGSDGYSTFVAGLARATGWDFVVANTLVGVLLVGLGWVRGNRPGPGTVVQSLVVGFAVSAGLAVTSEPSGTAVRWLLLVLALPVLSVGIAGYLNTASGAGPAEVAALTFDPPVPFRWGYNTLQGLGALGGWLMGADVGPGTLLVVVALGPAVAALRRVLPRWDEPVAGRLPGATRSAR